MGLFSSKLKLVDEETINAENLFGRYAGMVIEKQIKISETIGKMSWDLSLIEGKVTFGDDIIVDIQLIGSYSNKDSTWLWAWENYYNINPNLKCMKDINKLRKYGEEINDMFLCEPCIKASKEIVHRVGTIACGLYDSSFYYCGEYGDGYVVFTVKEKTINKNLVYKLEMIIDNIQLLASTYDIDQRYAIYYYLKQKKFQVTQKKRKIIAIIDNINLIIEFNNTNKLKKIIKNDI